MAPQSLPPKPALPHCAFRYVWLPDCRVPVTLGVEFGDQRVRLRVAPCGAPRSCRRVGTNAEPRLLRGYRCACPQAAGRPIGVGSAEVTQCPAWPTKREGYEETDKRGGTVGRKLAVSAWGRAWLAAVGTWTRTRVSVGVYSCARKVCLWGSGAWRVGVLRDAVSTCPTRWSSWLGATRSQRRSRLEL